METNKGRGRSEKGNPLKKLEKAAKTGTAYLVCIALIAVCLEGSLALASGNGSEESADEQYSMTIDELCDAVEYAVRGGAPLDEGEFEFSGNNAGEYEKLFDTEDGLLYEIYPDLDEEGDSLTLRTFARLKKSDLEEMSAKTTEDGEEAVKEQDDYEEASENDAEDDYESFYEYNITGNEEIIFLLINNTDDEVSARIHVTTSDEIYETKKITVPGNKSEESIMLDTLESMDTMEYVVVDNKNENVETAALKVETDSDADQTVTASNGSGSGSVSVVATEKVESASNAANSNPSGAYTDGCTAMSGTLYDPTTIDDQPAVAFATTLKKLGVDYGIKLLEEVRAGTADEFKEAIEAAKDGDTVELEADITVDCTSEDFVKITTAGITVDLGNHTITVTGSSDNYYLFNIRCGGAFTLKNGTIDGGENENAAITAVHSAVASNDVTLDEVTIQNFGSVHNGVVHAAADALTGNAGNLTVKNCTIQNNQTHGIYTNGCQDITIECSTISGNDASGITTKGDSAERYGGGICITRERGSISITNNNISGNKAKDGGGIYIDELTSGASSGEFAVTGNTITNNVASTDGGGIFFEADTATAEEGVGDFDLSGNVICSNEASSSSGYGGGIALRVNVTGREVVIKSGIIKGNSAYWGGGIDSSFVEYQSVLHLYNTIITENTAKARGGGIWACPNSETTMNVTYGAAIYGNTASGRTSAWTYGLSGDDIRFEGSDTDTTNGQNASGSVYVSTRALGGTLMDWYADDDSRGTRYTEGAEPVDVTSERYRGFVNSFGLHGELSQEGISLAEDEALLYIAGNTSETVGGGIATNTPVEFGEATSLTVMAHKVWKEKDGETDLPDDEIKDYSVDITLVRIDESGKEVNLETVTLNADNEWTWAFKDLPASYMSEDSDEHFYTYTVRESNARTEGFFEVSVVAGDVEENEDGTLEQNMTITNIRREEPELTKEELEDDYERKGEDIEHDDSNGHFEENIEGDGWGTWDDADNNQEITYRLTLEHIKDVHEMVIHDYLEEGLTFEPDTVSIVMYENSSDTTGRKLTQGENSESQNYDYYVTQGDCSDTGSPSDWMDGCTFEVHFAEWLFDPELEHPESDEKAQALDDGAYVVITYNAITETHPVDYFEGEHEYEDIILNDAYSTGSYGYWDEGEELGWQWISTLFFRTVPINTETELFGFGIYKYATSDGEEIALEGAEFVLSEEGRLEDGSTGTRYAAFEKETDENVGDAYMVTGWVEDIDSAGILISGSDGMIRIEGLDDDTYTLTETRAPSGYETIAESFTIVINENGSVTVDGLTGSKELIDGHVVNVENIETETVNVSGGKTWDDNNDAEGKRPDSITIYLMAESEIVEILTVSADDDWTWNFTDLPKYKEDGITEIVYTIDEADVLYYEPTVDGYDVINKYTPGDSEYPATGDLKISKNVTGSGGSTTADFSFSLELSGGTAGETYDVANSDDVVIGQITFDENGSASYEFTLKHGESITVKYLPEGIAYTISETNSNGYTVSIKGVTTVEGLSGSGEISSDGVEVTFTNSRGSTTTTSTGGGGGYSGSGSSHNNSSSSGPGAENTAHESSGGGDSSGSSIGTDSIGGLPQTGESNVAMFLIGVCIALAAVLVVLLYMRRRTPNDQE